MSTSPEIDADYNVASDEEALAAVAAATTHDEARRGLTALLLRPNPMALLEAIEEQGLMLRWLPEMMELRGVSQMPDHVIDALTHSYQACAAALPTVLSRWTALLHDIGKATTRLSTPEGRTRFFNHEKVGAEMVWPLLLRLGFPADFVDSVACLINLHLRPLAYNADWTDNAVRRLFDEAGVLWPALLAQARADLLGYAPEPVDRALQKLDLLASRAEAIRKPKARPPASPLDGTELMAIFDRPPGAWLRTVKAVLETEVRNGRLRPDDKVRAEHLARLAVARLDRDAPPEVAQPPRET